MGSFVGVSHVNVFGILGFLRSLWWFSCKVACLLNRFFEQWGVGRAGGLSLPFECRSDIFFLRMTVKVLGAPMRNEFSERGFEANWLLICGYQGFCVK